MRLIGFLKNLGTDDILFEVTHTVSKIVNIRKNNQISWK